mmetsp:Transcript_38830/g.70049  ORF Transcript_38830/g.70049 Transcript_38830/m.70049 type:complete len:329 (+) Transcript_38830:26-1012(+)
MDLQHGDPYAHQAALVQSGFLSKEDVHAVAAARRKYPQRKGKAEAQAGNGEAKDTGATPRRIPGMRLGFERIFATTSIKLPVSAYTVHTELHSKASLDTWSRTFGGLNVVFDLKKWIFEKLLLPMNAYQLSYAESGKAELADNMKLLTIEESLDTRTMATTRAVHNMYKRSTGVHSINDIGVTNLHIRLTCRICGRVATGFENPKCVGKVRHGSNDGIPLDSFLYPQSEPKEQKSVVTKAASKATATVALSEHNPLQQDLYVPHERGASCVYDSKGYELYQAARSLGSSGYSIIAQVKLSCGNSPSRVAADELPNMSGRLRETAGIIF